MFFSRQRQQSQDWLIRLMQRLGLSPRVGGICFGFAAMAMQSMLGFEVEGFNASLRELFAIYASSRVSGVEASLLQLLTGVGLYADPSSYAELLSIKGVAAQSVMLVAPFMMSERIKSQGGIAEIGNTIGNYSVSDLKKYLNVLAEQHQGTNVPISLMVSNSEHTISISYQYGAWVLADADQFPVKQDIDSKHIAKEIFAAFKAGNCLTLNIDMFTTETFRQIASHVVNRFQLDENITCIHKITPDNVDRSDRSGATQLTLAVMNSKLERATLCIANGAYVHAVYGPNRMSLMSLAADRGDTKMVELLISYGADVNVQVEDGRSALFIAVQRRDFKTARLLLRNGARTDVLRKEDGASMLYVAAATNQPEMVKLLLHHGANPSVGRQLGNYTPLAIAEGKGFGGVVEVFARVGVRR